MGTTVVSTITARLEADTQDFQAGMAQATQTTGRLEGGFQKANVGTTALRRGLTGLAFQLTGTTGPLGRVAAGLLLFEGGSTLVLGVAAGIAAIGLAIRAFTQDSRDNRAAQDELAKSLDALGTHAQVAAAKVRLASLQAQLAESGPLITLWRGLKGIFGDSPAEQNERLKQQIAELEGLIGRLTTKFESPWTSALRTSNIALREAQLRFAMLGQPIDVVEEAVKRLGLELEHYPTRNAAAIAANERLAHSLELTATSFDAAFQRVGEANIKMRMLGASVLDVNEALERQRLINQGVTPEQAAQVAALDKIAASRERFAATFHQIFGDMDQQMLNAGVQFGRDIIDGLMSGMLKMDDILRRFVTSFLSSTIFGVIGGFLAKLFGQGPAFGGGGGTFGVDSGASSGGGTGGISGSRIAPASFTLNVGGLPAPTTPFAVMRDAEWIRVLTGSLMQARANGFR